MALATVFNQPFHRGDDLKFIFTVRDPAGAVVDITAAAEITYAIGLKSPTAIAPIAGSTLVTKTLTGTDITITDGPNGVFEFSVASADTVGFVAQDYYHEIQILLAGLNNTIMIGTLTLCDDLIAPGP